MSSGWDEQAGVPSDGTTLSEVLAGYEEAGYRAQLVADAGGGVTCPACGTTTPAAELDLESLRRLEGASDPADMAGVLAVVCRACGAKGTVVVQYGPLAGEEDVAVLLAVQDHRGHGETPAARSPREAAEQGPPRRGAGG